MGKLNTSNRLNKLIELDKREIRSFAQTKGIAEVVHFTPLENLPSIARSCTLYNRVILDDPTSSEKCVITDYQRGDGARWAVCCTIEWPNFRMLSQKRRFQGQEFAILVLDASLLWELNCVFLPVNAATTHISSRIPQMRQDIYGKAKQLRDLYPHVDERPEEWQKYPTDIQAEVLVDEQAIDLKRYGRNIIFRYDEDYQEYCYVRWPKQMESYIWPKFFGHRLDGAS